MSDAARAHVIDASPDAHFERGTPSPERVFGDAFHRAIFTSPLPTLAALRSATADLARGMRRRGMPPEQGLVALKTLIVKHGTGLHPSLARCPTATPTGEDLLYATVFGAWLHAWFDDAPAHDAAQPVAAIDRTVSAADGCTVAPPPRS